MTKNQKRHFIDTVKKFIFIMSLGKHFRTVARAVTATRSSSKGSGLAQGTRSSRDKSLAPCRNQETLRLTSSSCTYYSTIIIIIIMSSKDSKLAAASSSSSTTPLRRSKRMGTSSSPYAKRSRKDDSAAAHTDMQASWTDMYQRLCDYH